MDNNSDLFNEINIKDKYIFNFLSLDQINLATKLAVKENHDFKSIDHIDNDYGPIIKQSLGWISCSKKESINVGDHLIIIGLVNDFKIFDNNKKPLIFWSGNYQI